MCKNVLKVTSLLVFSALISTQLKAQSGNLDLSFNSVGSTTAVNTASNTYPGPTKVVEFPSNGINSPGNLYQLSTVLDGGFYKLRVSSFLPSGAINTSFNGGLGYRVYDLIPGASLIGKDITLRSDSKIVVGFQVNAGNVDAGVMVIETNGNLTTSFNSTGFVTVDVNSNSTDEVGAVATSANGSVFVGGGTSSDAVSFDTYLLRIDINGVLQGTQIHDFVPGFGSYEKVASMDVKHDPANPFMCIENKGIISVHGNDQFFSFNSNLLFRFGINLTGDATFGPSSDGIFTVNGVTEVTDIAHDDVNGGWFALSRNSGTGELLKLSETGAAVTTFGTMGTGNVAFGFGGPFNPTGVEIRTDGKISVVGLSNTNLGVLRLNANGTFDNSFSGDGQNIIPTGIPSTTLYNVYNCIVQSDNKVVFGAQYYNASPSYFDLLYRINGMPITGDCNNDGIISATEAVGDVDCSGAIERPTEVCGDADGDGTINNNEIAGDQNGDGTINRPSEVAGDLNGDGDTADADEVAGDTDGDGTITFPGEVCGDLNGDGDTDESDEVSGDQNGDGVINRPTEVAGDLNGNGTIDIPTETAGDTNGDGTITTPGEISGDLNGNGTIERPAEVAGDLNGNGTIDRPAEIAGDTNGDGVITLPTELCGDLNGNGLLDNPAETGGDQNGNGTIENPEVLGDLNGDGVLNAQDFVGIDEVKIEFSVYPNPASEQLLISSDKNIEQVAILDMAGRVIDVQTVNDVQTILSINTLTKGTYQILVTSNGVNSAKTFIKL